MSYSDLILNRIKITKSALCIGLDPRAENHKSEKEIEYFCEKIIEETHPLTAAFKPNIAYFEALGSSGYAMLERLILKIKKLNTPIILDAKRGDIGTTQEHYAKAYFENWDVDSVTLSPYMGMDSIEPFLKYKNKSVYLLGLTSNKGSIDIQKQSLKDNKKVYQLVASIIDKILINETNSYKSEAGVVLGLTNINSTVIEEFPDVPMLIPGLGAQQGDMENLCFKKKFSPSLINVSRGILYSNKEKSFFDKAKFYADKIANFI